MSDIAKFFIFLFGLFALLALGHDIYIWQTSRNPFAFAALGWITKHYAQEQHEFFVQMVSPEIFNLVFAPFFSIPLFFSMSGFALLSWALGYAAQRFGQARKKRAFQSKPHPTKGFSYKRR